MTDFTMSRDNFFWPARRLAERDEKGHFRRRTPAMAAGLADHAWTMRDRITIPGVQRREDATQSWIKQRDQRVDGSDRYWEGGRRGETILQVWATWQEEDEAWKFHLKNRPGQPYSRPRPQSERAA